MQPQKNLDEKDLQERVKKDKRILIESCFQVVHGDTQKAVPFIFRPEQRKYWDNRTQCDIILKPRKRGFSALIDAEFLASCITEENTNAVVVSHRDEDAKILFERVRWMKNNLPFEVPTEQDGTSGMKFKLTGSSFKVITAGATEPRRGSDITHLHMSERAFYTNETVLAAIEGACTKNARRIMETTANGAGTPFHKFWLKTKQGMTAYKWHFFPWWAADDYEIDPGPNGLGEFDDAESKLKEAYSLSDRKLAWRRHTIRLMTNPDLFDQEFPHSDDVAFLVSGRMVFDWVSIQRQRNAISPIKWQGKLRNVERKIELEPYADGPLKIWATPQESRRYIISADIAEGLSDGAWSVADVLDTSTWEQVAQWRGHCSPLDFADVLGDLGAYYNWATVCPEVNNHGLATCGRLADGGYPNLYVREQKQEGINYGWLTTAKSKILLVNALSHAIKHMDVKINSEATLDELKSFVYTEGRKEMTHQAGSFSDCVMSLGIGISLLGEMRETPQTQRQRFREALGIPRRNYTEMRELGGYGVRKC